MVGKRRCRRGSTAAQTGPFGLPATYLSRLTQGVHVTETLASSANSDLPLEPDPRRWSILAVVIIAQLMVVLDASIVTIALPSAQRALHISVANRQWVITAYTLAFGGLLLLGGRIADFGGRKRMFFVGLLGFAAASALGGLAVNQAMLFGARALQGAFAALMAPAALSILTITFEHDPRERAKAFGAYGAVSGAGGAIGVLAGGVLTQYASWRWCLLVNVPIALLAAVAAVRVVHESRAPGTTRYDVPGALLSTLGLVSLVYGFTRATTDGWASAPTLAFLSVAVVPVGGLRRGRSSHDQPTAPAAGGGRAEPGWLVPGLVPGRRRALRDVRLPQLLHAGSAPLLRPQGRHRVPSLRGRNRRRGGRLQRDRPPDRTAVPMAGGLLIGAIGLGLAHPDRRAHLVLGVRVRTPGPDEPRSRSLVPGVRQHGAGEGPRERRRRRERPGEHHPAGRRFPRHRAVEHGGGDGDCGLPRRPMGRPSPRQGLVHGYSVAFALGAGMLLLAAIVSAVFVTGGPREAAVSTDEPALALA